MGRGNTAHPRALDVIAAAVPRHAAGRTTGPLCNGGASARTAPLHLPGSGRGAARYSRPPADTGFLLASRASLGKSGTLEWSSGTPAVPQPPQPFTLQESEPNPSCRRTFPREATARWRWPFRRSHVPGSSSPFLSSRLLCPACLPCRQRAEQPAASPAPAPNALATAVGLIMKITF